MSEKNLMYIFIKKIMSYFYQRADKIICLTDEAKDYFKNIGCEAKAILVPPGIKLNGNISEQFPPKPTEEFKVIYAGSFQPIYPLDKLIRAAKIISDSGHKNIKFELVGNGIQKDSLKKLADELNVNNVDFLEPLPKEELLKFLKSASAFVLIEKKASYGFPNKIIDYLSVGRPIIYVSPVRHKILKSGCCIEASNDNPEEIAESVINIASMPESKRMKMMSNAREFLHKHHDIEIIAQNFIEHLK
jgi:glycosyltransferase involved in cell wall biosynthesis